MSDKMFFKGLSKSMGNLISETKDSLTFVENNEITIYLFDNKGMLENLITKEK